METNFIKGQLDPLDLKRGSHVIIDQRPYKVTCVQHTKPYRRTMITAEDLFTTQKKTIIIQAGKTIPEPIVTKKEYDVTNFKTDNYLTLFDPKTETSIDIQVDTETYNQLKSKLKAESEKVVTVIVLHSMGGNKIC